MSEERPINRIFPVKADNSPVQDHSDEPTQIIYTNTLQPEAAARITAAQRGELKAKLAAILDRSSPSDRFKIELPPHLHGEWCRNDPYEVARLETLGFQVDTEYAPKRALHSDGSESAVIGDVVHMIAPIEVKQLVDEIRREEMINRHTKKKGKHKEEQDYEKLVNKDTDGIIPTMVESVTHDATIDSVAAALKESILQTQPAGR